MHGSSADNIGTRTDGLTLSADSVGRYFDVILSVDNVRPCVGCQYCWLTSCTFLHNIIMNILLTVYFSLMSAITPC